jgi:P63C domain
MKRLTDEELEKKRQIEEARQFLMDSILEQTENLTAKQAVKKNKEKEDEILQLIGGGSLSISQWKSFLTNHANQHPYLFPNDVPFYTEIYRLNKWDNLNPYSFTKPPAVAHWTNILIYNRFPKELLPVIQIINPFISGTCLRWDKNYNYLNDEGYLMAIKFRDQAIEMMKKCSTWHEFRLKMSKEHGVPYVYQKEMF